MRGKSSVAVLSTGWLILGNIVIYILNGNSEVAKSAGFRGLLAVSNRANGIAVKHRPDEFYAWDLLDPEDLISGHLFGPIPVLTYRILVLIFIACTLVYQDRLGSGFTPRWFILLSSWNFVAMALYAILGIGVSLKRILSGTKSTWGILEKLFVGTFVSASTTGIFITAFFWALIYKELKPRDEDFCYHGINVLLMLGEIFVSKIPLCSYHLQIAFQYGTVYAYFTFWVYLSTQGWAYRVMSWEKYENLIYYFITPFVMAASFYTMFFLAILREQIFGPQDALGDPSIENRCKTSEGLSLMASTLKTS